jgi:hypothetical protein
MRFGTLKKSGKIIQKSLALILAYDIVRPTIFVKPRPMAAKNS